MCSAAGAMPSHYPWAIISRPLTLLLTVSTNRRPGYTGRGRNIVGGGLFGNESHNWAVWYLGRQRKRRKDQRDPPSALQSPTAHPANTGNRSPQGPAWAGSCRHGTGLPRARGAILPASPCRDALPLWLSSALGRQQLYSKGLKERSDKSKDVLKMFLVVLI